MTTYSVTGLTCGHCVGAVSTELSTLPGVSGVDIDLNAGGISTVRVASESELDIAVIAAALDEVGGYALADQG